jgi:hypothetical protein
VVDNTSLILFSTEVVGTDIVEVGAIGVAILVGELLGNGRVDDFVPVIQDASSNGSVRERVKLMHIAEKR